MTALARSMAAYTQSLPARPLQSFPALSFTWDGAATPSLTVKEVSDGTTCAVYSGQALIQDGLPPSLVAASVGANSWEVGPA